MTIESKINTFKRCFLFSGYGHNFRDKLILFVIGLINQADPEKRIILHKFLQNIMNFYSEDDFCNIFFKNPGYSGKHEIKLRNKNQADYQSIFECLAYGMYERPENDIKYIFDAGGHLGFFSIYSAYTSNPDEILIVEPNPDNFMILKENVLPLMKYINLKLHQVALDEYDGIAEFDIFSSNNSKLSNTTGFRNSRSRIEVKTKSILNLIPSSWNMNQTWLKLDIEGAEYKVLTQLLESSLRPKIVSMEIHDYINSDGERLVKQLKDAGYQIRISGYGNSGYVCRQVNANYMD